MIYISPSVLSADFSDLANSIKKVEDGGAEYLHLDVMDGAFVPNISFGPCVIASIRNKSKMVFDVHLMINDPIRYIDDYVKAGADIITIHYESCADPLATIEYIKSKGVKAAVSIKPKTAPEVIFDLLDKVDMVLVMTVEPGFGGQKLIPETLPKIAVLRREANKRGLTSLQIEVDGGITPDNVALLTENGADVIVAGSAVFGAKDPAAAIAALKETGNANPFKG